MIAIDDPDLPGLANLSPAILRRITGAQDVSLVRFRYRAGRRAILHLDTGTCEGSVWFFKGDKARRLARRNKRTARYDPGTEALFEIFPNDHRMPQIRAFVENYSDTVSRLLGACPDGTPEVLRYRPGLSCTFRCRLADGSAAFVKLINNDSTDRLAEMNRRLVSHLADGPVSVAPVTGTDVRLSALAYAGAPGRSLGEHLAMSGSVDAVQQSIDALQRFWDLPLIPPRRQTAEVLLERAAESMALTNVTVPEVRAPVERILSRLRATDPAFTARPIHADMKLEHLFIDGARTTLIDTESVSFGPPDYDLAQLYGRLWQAELEGLLPYDVVEKAAREVRKNAGPAFDWCLDIVALRLAKFHAQRPSPQAAERIFAILERLS